MLHISGLILFLFRNTDNSAFKYFFFISFPEDMPSYVCLWGLTQLLCFSLRFFSSLSGSVLLLFRYQEARTCSSAFLLLLRVVFSFSVSHTHCCPFSQELQQRKRESKCRISRLHCFQSRLLLHVGRLCFKTKIFSGCKRAFTGYCSQTCQCALALACFCFARSAETAAPRLK